MNEQRSQSEEPENVLLGWTHVKGCRALTAVDGAAREGTTKQQGFVLKRQALGDTLKHIHAFTHRHGRAHAPAHCHTDSLWHLRGQPHRLHQSWVLKLIDALPCSSSDP